MQNNQIKEGQSYAVSTAPRKGITDLYGIPATRVRVTEKDVRRFAGTAKDEFGNYGTYKNDGIKGMVFTGGGAEVESSTIYKARDFLMPWREYEAERDVRRAKADVQRAEREEAQRQAEQRRDRMRASLESFGLDVSDTGWPMPGKCSVDTAHVALSIDQAEKLLGSIAERIYEGIRDAT